jgi:hypothetical protein
VFGRWQIVHPTTHNPWGTTSGWNAFHEFVVAFSSDFQRTYSRLNESSWKVTVTGKNDGTGKWTDDGSSVTGDTKLGNGPDGKFQVLGLSFANEYDIICNPGNVSCR